MRPINAICRLIFLAPVLGALLFVRPATSQSLPSETPAKFVPATDSFDFVKREVMIPDQHLKDKVRMPMLRRSRRLKLGRTPGGG